MNFSVAFACRDFKDAWHQEVKRQKFDLFLLPQLSSSPNNWLGCSQEVDASDFTNLILNVHPVDMVIVDHYAIDSTWEVIVRSKRRKLFCIDDLANRAHVCDAILDQSLSPNGERYDHLVPRDCTKLLGPKYALLSPAYPAKRLSLNLENRPVRKILVFFGGSDSANLTTQAIEALNCQEFVGIEKYVVAGPLNKHLTQIMEDAKRLDPSFTIFPSVTSMPDLLADMDFAIAAGGVNSWERCCLGVPSLVAIVADNQKESTDALAAIGAVEYLGYANEIKPSDIHSKTLEILANPPRLNEMRKKALAVVDGYGCIRAATSINLLLSRI